MSISNAAVSRQGPDINGLLEGDLYQLEGDSVNMNSGGRIEGTWYLPGTPDLVLQGGTLQSGTVSHGDGSLEPQGYTIRLNNNSYVGAMVDRTELLDLPVAGAVLPSSGNRTVHINGSSDTIGDPSTLKNLTINANNVQVALPGGAYNQISVNGKSTLTLGTAGATEAEVYDLTQLHLNSKSHLEVVGPVLLRLKQQFNPNAVVGNEEHPEWLRIEMPTSGMNINSKANVYAVVIAPSKSVHINGLLEGGVYADKVKINSKGVYRERASIYPPDTSNQPPLALSESFTLLEDSTFMEQLQGSDPDGDTLTFFLLTTTANGVVNLSDSGALSYVPAENFFGQDTFTFQVSDGVDTSEPATIQLNITSVNDLPVARVEPFSVLEDTATPIELTIEDIDSTNFSIEVLSASNGVLTGTLGNLLFTPNANYSGAADFSLKVLDGDGGEVILLESFVVGEVNDPPVPGPTVFTTDEDTLLEGLLEATDIEGELLTFALLEDTANGIVILLPDGTFSYTPGADFNGLDTFEASVEDASGALVVFEVGLTVNPVNDAPQAVDQSFGLKEDEALNQLVVASDVENDPISFVLSVLPSNGVATVASDGSFTYTPNENYNGLDQIGVTVADDLGAESAFSILLTVDPVNDAPQATAASYQVNEDLVLSDQLAGTDIDGDILTFAVSTLAGQGVVAVNTDGSFTYTPNENFNGSDSFSFTVSDGEEVSAAATVSIAVIPVNDAPTAEDQSFETDEDVELSSALLSSDLDGDVLTFALSASPQNGDVALNTSGSFTYRPSSGFSGTDSFVATVTDGIETIFIDVSLTIQSVNDAPVADDLSFNLNEDNSLSENLIGEDEDGDSLTYVILSLPTHGTLRNSSGETIGSSDLPLSLEDSAFSYLPNSNFNGSDVFTYWVTDGQLTSAVATVSLSILPVNDAPVGNDAAVLTNEDVALSATLSAFDVDSSSLVFSVLSAPSNGTVVVNTDGTYVYTPNADFNGADFFDFTVSDGLVTGSARISIDVQAVNDAPLADVQSLSVNEDATLQIILSGSDVEGDSLSFQIAASPSSGVLSGIAPNLTYTPAADFNGSDSFTFTVSDGTLSSSPALVQITVNPVNDAPRFIDSIESADLVVNTDNDILSYQFIASDPDGDAITYSVEGSPNATIDSSGNLYWEPGAGDVGEVLLTVYATDSYNADASISLLATVGLNARPYAIPQAVQFDPGQVGEIILKAIDDQSSELQFELLGTSSLGGISGAEQTDNDAYRLEFQAGLVSGSEEIQFKVTDLYGQEATATLILTVRGIVNQAPLVDAGIDQTYRNVKQVQLNGTVSDDGLPDNEGVLTEWTIVSGPVATITETSNPNALVELTSAGTYEFQLTASDGQLSGSDRVIIQLVEVNVAPEISLADRIVHDTGEELFMQAYVTDDGLPGEELLYIWEQLSGPSSAQLVASGDGQVSIRFPEAGEYHIRLRVTDGSLESSEDVVIIVSLPVDSPYFISLPVESHALGGGDYYYNAQALHPLSLDLSYTLLNGPEGMVINEANGSVLWQLPEAAAGVYPVTIEATATDGSSVSQSYQITAIPELDIILSELIDIQLEYDANDSSVFGTITCELVNGGSFAVSEAFDLVAFEDLNNDQVFTDGLDIWLGEVMVPGLTEESSRLVEITVDGMLSYNGAHLSLFANQSGVVVERNLENNYLNTLPDCSYNFIVGTFDPVLEWEWSGADGYKQSFTAPAVGDIDKDFVPEIIGMVYTDGGQNRVGRLVRLDGKTGEVERFTSDGNPNGASTVAIGDLEGDGSVEVIACSTGNRLLIYNSDLQLLHIGDAITTSSRPDYGAPALADLNQDGISEIIMGRSVFDYEGKLIWTGAGTDGANTGGSPVVAIADIDLDGKPNVVAGPTVYREDGSILWRNSAIGNGYPAVANFDDDAYAEVVVVYSRRVYLLDHDGTLIWSVAIDGTGGTPCIGDFDGDGAPEVGVAGKYYYHALDSDGSLMWRNPINDASSELTGSTVFDFEGDGNNEIVYNDQGFLYIYDGLTGEIRAQIVNSNRTWIECPVVADVDGDGNAEIVVSANDERGGNNLGYRVFGDLNDTWLPTRSVWNQHAYSVTNVNDDLTIPVEVTPNWLEYNHFRVNELTNGCKYARPDLTVGLFRVDPDDSTRALLRVANAGLIGVASGLPVAFYSGAPEEGASTLLSVFTIPDELAAFDYIEISLPVEDLIGGTELWIAVDDLGNGTGLHTEISELNNIYQTGFRFDGFENQAPTVDAGIDLLISLADSPIQLSASTSDDQKPLLELQYDWSLVSGPGSSVLSGDDSRTPTVSFVEPGTYVFSLSVFDGESSAADSVTVVVEPDPSGIVRPIISAGGPYYFTLNGLPEELEADMQNVPETASIEWISEDPSLSILAGGETATPSISASLSGTYSVRLRVVSGPYVVEDTAQIHVLPASNQIPVISEIDVLVEAIAGIPFEIRVTANDDNLPSGRALTAVVQFISGPEQPTMGRTVFGINPGVPETVGIYAALPGIYVFNVEVSDSFATTSSQFSVHVLSADNQAPQVGLSGPDSVLYGDPLLVSASFQDDGLPSGVLRSEWNILEAPAAVQIIPVEDGAFELSFGQIGQYILEFRVTDGERDASVLHTVEVLPKQTAVPVISIDSPLDGARVPVGSDFLITTTSSDADGYILSTILSINGSEVSETRNAPFSFYQSLPAGNHVMTVQAVDNSGTLSEVSEEVNVISSIEPPFVELVEPARDKVFLLTSEQLQVTANATDTNGPVTEVFFKVNGTPVFVDQTAPWTLELPEFSPGTHTLSAVAVNSRGLTSGSDPITIIVSNELPTLNARIESPLADTVISAPIAILGTADSNALDYYILEYRLKDTEQWLELVTESASVQNAELTTFDPTLLLNGLYELRLTVTDLLGRSVSDQVTVAVDGSMKVGNFALAFEDLSVPMAGIPIQIIRSYDSRDTRMGDFGTGWALAINDIRLRKNGPVGSDWSQDQIIVNLPVVGATSAYCLEPRGKRMISVTFPDGEQYLFEASIDMGHGRDDIEDNCQLFTPIGSSAIVYTPKGDTTGTLEAVDDSTVYSYRFIGQTDLYTEDPEVNFNAPVYNPTRFILTTADGTRYLIDEDEGLISMEDLNGNRLEIFDDRIVSTAIDPNGGADIVREVNFLRDGEGRITTITDPDGNTLDYGYEVGQGGLRSFTNRVDETTQFVYADSRYPDYLTDILDPRGIQAIRTEYDDEGRIARQIDADGNPINFEHDLDNFAERVTDRLGHTTTYYYDELGNVTRQIDALGAETHFEYYPGTTLVKYETDDAGNVVSRAYDSQENLLVEITGALITEEPLTATTGFITRYTYNKFSSPLSITDPNGNLTEFTYDSKGNLLSQIQYGEGGATQTTNFTYNAGGDIRTIIDAEGNLTFYAYTYGISDPEFPTAVKRQANSVSDATLGVLRITEGLYDRQDNLLVERFDRTLPDGSTETIQTSYRYDEENRLIATILPDGQVAETRYNNIGKEAASIRWQTVADYEANDLSLARVMTMDYDDRGNLIRSDYPDGTYTSSVYDLEGRMVSSINQLGETTYMVYDALGRQTETIHPDGTMPADPSILNSSSLILNSTELADNPTTSTVYDTIGRVEFTIDALGNIAQNIYDDACACAGRLKQTRRYLDSEDLTSNSYLQTSFIYDENGNQTHVTDPKGNVTEFIYDAYNRLVQTILPEVEIEGGSTSPSTTNRQTIYDELGRRVASIDQEGKRTEFSYDALGRLIEVRTPHPDGTSHSPLSTTYSYDSAGNRRSETDAEGNTTRFEYDNMGRRTKRILPEGEEESYVYNGWGELESRTDFNGHVTSYTYDVMSRLLTERADATAFPSEVGITYSYDALGRIETMVDASGTTTHVFDERGNLKSKTNASGTLTYTYDAANNLKSTVSSSTGGLDVSYDYDSLNRLDTVTDSGAAQPPLEHSYSYDANGNLESLTYSNGVSHTWTYDSQNRLKNLSVLNSSLAILNSYAYELKATGYRTKITEASGRVVDYAYDNHYRLTQESISGSTNPLLKETSDWGYDLVGNRLSQASDIDQIFNLAESYSDNNWLDSHIYDSNGNTTTSSSYAEPAITLNDIYDWRNRLVRREKSDGTVIEVVYDGNGDRIKKTVTPFGGPNEITWFLVDRNNLTDYAQVVEEIAQGGEIEVIYTYGLDLISQDRRDSDGSDNFTQSFYLYDGLGSIRALTDENSNVTDEYTYDAWGVLLELNGTTENAYRFTGEQWDADLEMVFLRARYLNTSVGRFHTMDTFEGIATDPVTLHKYLYVHADPVNGVDPSGNLRIGEVALSLYVRTLLFTIKHPRVFFVAGLVSSVLIPESVDQALIGSGIPGYQGISAARKGQLSLLRIVKSKWISRRLESSLLGKLSNVAGNTFESVMGNVVFRNAQRQIPVSTVTNHSTDFLWRGRLFELKTSTSITKNNAQLRAIAEYSRSNGLPFVYMFLKQPTSSTVRNIEEAGGTVISIFDS